MVVSAWHKLAGFLALRRNTSLLLLTLVLAGTGERLWMGFAPKYLETLGAGVFIIGLFDALQTLLGAVYAYPGGWLTDRWGQRRSLLFIATVFLAFLVNPQAKTAAQGTGEAAVGFVGVVKSFSPALRELLVSDILIRFCERIPYAFVILWAMNHGGVNAQQFGVLAAIEMVTAMLCYIPVAHWADKYGRRPFVLATFVFFTLFPLSLIWADNFDWLAAAFAVRGLKEFGEPARKALIIGEAKPELRSRTYGAYYLIRDCVVTSGSFLGAWLWSVSPQANFAGAAVCGALGTLWFWWFVCGSKGTARQEPRPSTRDLV